MVCMWALRLVCLSPPGFARGDGNKPEAHIKTMGMRRGLRPLRMQIAETSSGGFRDGVKEWVGIKDSHTSFTRREGQPVGSFAAHRLDPHADVRVLEKGPPDLFQAHEHSHGCG